jgi:hypothetical protein
MILNLTIEDLEKEEKCLKPHKTAVSSVPRHSEIVLPLFLKGRQDVRKVHSNDQPVRIRLKEIKRRYLGCPLVTPSTLER